MYTLKFDVRKPDPSYKFGLFRATLWNGKKQIKNKDGNLSVHGAKAAYKLLEETAIEWGNIYTITTFEKPSFQNMCNMYYDKLMKKDASPKEDTLTCIFGHAGKFKAALKAAYKTVGYDKVSTLLTESSTLLNEIDAPIRAENQAMADANCVMAWALYKITLSSGIDMSAKCVDANVERLYKSHFNEDGKPKTYYVLDGLRWNGLGNPPVEFKKWAQDNNKDNYDALLLRAGVTYG